MDNKSVWSWLVPGVLVVLCGLSCVFVTYWMGNTLVVLVPFSFGLLFAIVTLTEFLAYIRDQAIERAEREQALMIQTPDGHLAEQLRALASQSPELAAQMAHRLGRPDLVLFPDMYGRHQQVVISGSDVTLRFALHVLERSDDKSMAAQREFTDGAYHWDQNGEISDRQQWMQLNWLLSQQNMVTRYVPGQKTNHPPMWLPPWTPQRIIKNWLLGDALLPFRKYLRDHKEDA